MPRKRVLGPATAAQILDYFQTIDVPTGTVVLELCIGQFNKRRSPLTTMKVASKGRKAPKPEAADKPSLAEA